MISFVKAKVVDGNVVRQIPDFPSYWITCHGHVWSDERLCPTKKKIPGKWLKNIPSGDEEYYCIWLCKGAGKIRVKKNCRVHILVARCWIGLPPKEKPYVLHKNDIKTDNWYKNLYYGTDEDNLKDAIRNGCRRQAVKRN